jgi:transcriptional regulator with XRE-family HTH domain
MASEMSLLVGRLLKRKRQSLCLTEGDVAERVCVRSRDVTAAMILEIESGAQSPSMDVLVAIIKVYGIDDYQFSRLFDGMRARYRRIAARTRESVGS